MSIIINSEIQLNVQRRSNIFFTGISSTRIRKEALNIALSLGKKLRDTKNAEQFNQLTIVFQEFMPRLTKDNEPEIRIRLMDIKEIFKL